MSSEARFFRVAQQMGEEKEKEMRKRQEVEENGCTRNKRLEMPLLSPNLSSRVFFLVVDEAPRATSGFPFL